MNLAVAFYNMAAMWLFQLDVYPSWSGIPTADFGPAQNTHLLAVAAAVFPPALAATVFATILVVTRPRTYPAGLLRAGLVLQTVTWALTAFVFGPWQGRLTEGGASVDVAPRALGPANEHAYHAFVYTHWVRVALVTAYAALAWWLAVRTVAPKSSRA